MTGGGLAAARRGVALAGAALAAGGILYLAASLAEQGFGLDGAKAAAMEEGLKSCLLAAGAMGGSRVGRGARPGRGMAPHAAGLLWGLAAISVFAAVENLAYFLAFPASDLFLRLLWAEPAHLVAGLAEATGIGLMAGIPKAVAAGRPEAGTAAMDGAGAATLFAFAFLWHLAFNLAAGGRPSAGDMAIAFAANAAALFAFGRLFARRILIGGFIHGQR